MTAIRVPGRELGATAARLLLRRMDPHRWSTPDGGPDATRDAAGNYTVVLPSPLVVRESCGAGAARRGCGA
jgi:hypothetical protein